MKRQRYFPSRLAEQALWLENFQNQLPEHATALGLSVQQVADALADARWAYYLLMNWQPQVKASALAATQAVAAALSGDGTAFVSLPLFTVSPLPPGVVPVKTGALNRIFALVAMINRSPGFTHGIGIVLGTIGPEDPGPDMATLQPSFTVSLQNGQPYLNWTWGGYSAFLDMAELEVDRGSGFTLLAMDTTPGYLDIFPIPDVLTKWTYRMRYRVGDHAVGRWSAEQIIAVGG